VAPRAASRPPVDGKRRRLRLIAVCGGIACLGAILFWALASKEPVTHEIILGTQPGEERTFAGIKFCWCPAGSFTMGSPESEAGRKENEGPQHTVTLKQGFWMSKYEVTHGQWKSIAGFHPEALKGSENLPMQMIDWHECQDFLHKLNAKGGGTFRLPSEAEWEYACRAGTQTAFSFGETLSMEQANLDRSKSTDVGSFPENAWNLCDMHGNVREWCQDGWHEDYTGAPTDGSAWESPEGQNRVFRSGNWSDYDHGAVDRRSAARSNDIGGLHDQGLGFRIVRTP
jgi:formylglycine-generating enzyme required for sulfatase activity